MIYEWSAVLSSIPNHENNQGSLTSELTDHHSRILALSEHVSA